MCMMHHFREADWNKEAESYQIDGNKTWDQRGIENCASEGMGNAQKIPRKNQEENLDSIMAWTTQKKKKDI